MLATGGRPDPGVSRMARDGMCGGATKPSVAGAIKVIGRGARWFFADGECPRRHRASGRTRGLRAGHRSRSRHRRAFRARRPLGQSVRRADRAVRRSSMMVSRPQNNPPRGRPSLGYAAHSSSRDGSTAARLAVRSRWSAMARPRRPGGRSPHGISGGAGFSGGMKRNTKNQTDQQRAQQTKRTTASRPWKEALSMPAAGTKRRKVEEEWRPGSVARRGHEGAVEDRWWL